MAYCCSEVSRASLFNDAKSYIRKVRARLSGCTFTLLLSAIILWQNDTL